MRCWQTSWQTLCLKRLDDGIPALFEGPDAFAQLLVLLVTSAGSVYG